jgi:hypothetical protein
LWHRLPNKQLLIIILSIFLTGVLFWSLHDIRIKSLLSCASNDFAGHEKSHTHGHDDLTEQLRKILTWRKDHLSSLSKDKRRTIEEFLISIGVKVARTRCITMTREKSHRSKNQPVKKSKEQKHHYREQKCGHGCSVFNIKYLKQKQKPKIPTILKKHRVSHFSRKNKIH